MGYPLPQDIKWVCDKCGKYVKYEEAIFPDPNKFASFHKECYK